MREKSFITIISAIILLLVVLIINGCGKNESIHEEKSSEYEAVSIENNSEKQETTEEKPCVNQEDSKENNIGDQENVNENNTGDEKDITKEKPAEQETEEEITPEPYSVEPVEPVIWYADITQDGIDEKIVVDLTYVINYPITGEEQTIAVYSGSTSDLIWTGHADTVHPGWNGIYIYKDGRKEYLLIWKPMMYQGRANYNIRIFSLTEEGEEQEYASKSLDFDINRPEECDTDAISSYIDKVNNYLENSYVLVDTDNGTPVYSNENNKLQNCFDVSGILNEIDDMKKN